MNKRAQRIPMQFVRLAAAVAHQLPGLSSQTTGDPAHAGSPKLRGGMFKIGKLSALLMVLIASLASPALAQDILQLDAPCDNEKCLGWPFEIGAGYDSRELKFHSATGCYTVAVAGPDPAEDGKADEFFEVVSSSSSTREALDVSVDVALQATLGVGTFAGSFKMGLAKSMAASSFAQSIILRQTMVHPGKKTLTVTLNSDWQKRFADGEVAVRKKFRKQCGDFVIIGTNKISERLAYSTIERQDFSASQDLNIAVTWHVETEPVETEGEIDITNSEAMEKASSLTAWKFKGWGKERKPKNLVEISDAFHAAGSAGLGAKQAGYYTLLPVNSQNVIGFPVKNPMAKTSSADVLEQIVATIMDLQEALDSARFALGKASSEGDKDKLKFAWGDTHRDKYEKEVKSLSKGWNKDLTFLRDRAIACLKRDSKIFVEENIESEPDVKKLLDALEPYEYQREPKVGENSDGDEYIDLWEGQWNRFCKKLGETWGPEGNEGERLYEQFVRLPSRRHVDCSKMKKARVAYNTVGDTETHVRPTYKKMRLKRGPGDKSPGRTHYRFHGVVRYELDKAAELLNAKGFGEFYEFKKHPWGKRNRDGIFNTTYRTHNKGRLISVHMKALNLNPINTQTNEPFECKVLSIAKPTVLPEWPHKSERPSGSKKSIYPKGKFHGWADSGRVGANKNDKRYNANGIGGKGLNVLEFTNPGNKKKRKKGSYSALFKTGYVAVTAKNRLDLEVDTEMEESSGAGSRGRKRKAKSRKGTSILSKRRAQRARRVKKERARARGRYQKRRKKIGAWRANAGKGRKGKKGSSAKKPRKKPRPKSGKFSCKTAVNLCLGHPGKIWMNCLKKVSKTAGKKKKSCRPSSFTKGCVAKCRKAKGGPIGRDVCAKKCIKRKSPWKSTSKSKGKANKSKGKARKSKGKANKLKRNKGRFNCQKATKACLPHIGKIRDKCLKKVSKIAARKKAKCRPSKFIKRCSKKCKRAKGGPIGKDVCARQCLKKLKSKLWR